MINKLFRSTKDRFFAGVISGVSESYHLNLDIPLARLLFAVTSLFIPILIVVYIVAAIVIPKDSDIK